MGLASKLATAQAGGGGGYPAPGGYPQPGAYPQPPPQGAYPGPGPVPPRPGQPPQPGGPPYQQQQYQSYTPGAPPGAGRGQPPPGQYGQMPMMPEHNQYSSPPLPASPYAPPSQYGGYQSPPLPPRPPVSPFQPDQYGMPSLVQSPYSASPMQLSYNPSPIQPPYNPTPYNQPYPPVSPSPYQQPGMPSAPMQYGSSYQPQQPHYGGAPINPGVILSILQEAVRDNQLQQMFPNPQQLDQIARGVTTQVDQICSSWRIPKEVGMDIVKLALFDVIIYIDDSGSMAFEEGGERIKDLKVILSKVAYAAALFDQDGISLRFMNNDFQQNNIKSEQQISQVVDQIAFKGLTPMGTSLRNKVLEPLVLGPARQGQLQKPVLVIAITDGQPAGEPENAVEDAVIYATTELAKTRYGAGAVSFQFAQVGNDLRAREFLGKLDNNPRIGHLIDCTSNYEVEADEMSRANPPVNLTVELWLAKLMLGAIDSSYDAKDEKTAQRPNMPQGQYGAPGGYGGYPQPGQQPPGAYGQGPQPGGYGQPGQQPMPYGHGPQQGGYPPQGTYQPRPSGQGGPSQQPYQSQHPPPRPY